MSTKKNSVKSKTKQQYTTSSCELCSSLDCDDMVACDICTKWFHFECAGVTSDIKHKDWSCHSCKKSDSKSSVEKLDRLSSKKGSIQASQVSLPSSKTSSMTSRQKATALKKLEEEQAIKLDFLNRKYKIIECSVAESLSSDDDSTKDQVDEDLEKASMEYTLHWAKQVQKMSTDLSKKTRLNDLSMSVSDEEAELMNEENVRSYNIPQDEKPHLKQEPFRNQQFKWVRHGVESLKDLKVQDCQQRNVKFDQRGLSSTLNVPQQSLFGFGSSDVQDVKHKSNVGFGRTGDPNVQLVQADYGLGATGMQNNHETPINCGSKWSNVPNNEQQKLSFPYQPMSYASTNIHQQQPMSFGSTNIHQQQPMSFGSTNIHQQQPMSFASSNIHQQQPMSFGSTNVHQPQPPHFSNSNQGFCSNIPTFVNGLSGYVGYNGPLTPNHIAARHVFSKDLPHFYGKAEEWQMFLSALKNSTEACGFSDGDNLGRLQRCLKGDALEIVQSRLLYASSVPGVVETLHMMFGRSNLIIHNLLDKINKEPVPKADDLNSLRKFAISVQNLCATIQSTGNLEYLRNPILIQSLTDKMPSQIQLNWAYFKHGAGNVDLSVMGNWLYQLAQVVTEVINPSSVKVSDKKDKKEKNNRNNSQSANYVNAQSESESTKNSSRKAKCRACNSDTNHKLENCKKFKELSIDDKWSLIKKHKVCGACFGDHQYYKCTKKSKCGIDGCSYNHHVLLHNKKEIDKKENKVALPSPVSVSKEESSHANSHRSEASIKKLPDIFRIVPVILSYGSKSVRIFAYLDDGSNLTSLEEKVAQKLGAFGTVESLCVQWSFGNREVMQDSRQLTVRIRGVFDEAQEYSLNHVRTVKKLMLPTQSITKEWLELYPYFNGIPISDYNEAVPQMIIGLEYSKLMVSLETIEGDWTQPIACRTRLGWVIQGPNDESLQNNDSSNNSKYSLNMCECQSNDNGLHQLVKEFFSIENFGVSISDKLCESKEISRARKILEETTVKKGSRYESALLWRHDHSEFPDSLSMAKRRLDCVETKMKKDPVLSNRLRMYMADFVEKGYIRKLSPSEKEKIGPRTWYLPTFPVFNPKKPEKLRVVWDGAAKVKGKSLNSMLLVGPDQLVPLIDVLRRFRLKKIAVTGDIKEMFHQILVRQIDQDSQRFLWRDGDSTREPDVYVMQVLTFGSSCSPCVAQYVKNKNAMEFKDEFPRAVAAILNNHYVDDMIESTDTVAEAVQLIRDVQFIHQQAGFDLRNFVSNSSEVLESINGSNQCGNKVLDDNVNITTERVLGMYWNTTSDTFTYSLKFIKINFKSEEFMPTKRDVLRTVMSVFDPLGFLAHFVVYAKILLQEIWRVNIDWDDQLSTLLKSKWILWLEHLPKVEEIHIPRLYSMKMSPNPAKSVQLHLFVDASLEAYAAVAYFRVENDSGVDSCLVGAKSKVAPNKPMSVPRLELQGGVLGTRLADSVIKSHTGLQIDKTIIWCDSRTVLCWINSDIRRYSQFVAFRVGEILESTCKVEWRWIPSEHNVADEATKSKKIAELKSTSRWFIGPEFLRNEDSNWTFELNEPEFQTEEELRPYYLLTHLEIPVNQFIQYERFSNWNRLVRAVAHVLRFVERLKSNRDGVLGLLTTDELSRAENVLYKQVQYECFREEIVIVRWNESAPIEKQKEFDKTNFIRTCSPYLDEQGVMRVKGRIDAATSISESVRHPIILARNHHVTHLIVDYYHRKYLHLHHQTVLNEIKQKYWIPRLRVVLGVIRNQCQKCKNTAAAPKVPEMASLPVARLAIGMRPFTHSGIDYFGPLNVVVGRSVQKRWAVLITCMTTRAIHLEVAHSLDTSSCIMAIQNFISLRGQPLEIYSDNGTNFHGADNALRQEFEKLDKNRIQEEFTTSEMKWTFNPPTASHMGGSWERMVRIVKSCLDKVMTIRYPTDEVLTNLLRLVENIVNSRPLTYVSLDSPMDEILTPNHLLHGSSNGTKPLGDFTDVDLLKNTWKTAQIMANKFWSAFVLQYVPTLNQRSKWLKKVEPLKVDDIVLIVDENFKRNTWPKAIVVETFKDKLGQVRSAKVRTDLGTFLTRPVTKLIVLEVRNSNNHNKDVVKQPLNGGKDVVEQLL